MDNGHYSLIDMLDHQPDMFSDSKIKAMMSDIYDNMIGYMKNGNEEQVSSLIGTGGVKNFIKWFITTVYYPNTSDVKVISYVDENMNDIVDILSQAVSNLTPKEVINNMKEEKVDGADEVSEKSGSDSDAIEELKDDIKDEKLENGDADTGMNANPDEAQPENEQKQKSAHDIAFDFIDSMSR